MHFPHKLFREEINYLNMSEIKDIARKLRIPVNIHYEDEKGYLRKTSDLESKMYLLDKIDLFVSLGKTGKPVVYPAKVVCFESPKGEYQAGDRVLYKDFKSTNKALLKALRALTGDKFRFGAIAFIEAHKFWRQGKSCSLEEFSKLWLKAKKEQGSRLREEWAYMTDFSKGLKRSEWKTLRAKKAQEILEFISKN